MAQSVFFTTSLTFARMHAVIKSKRSGRGCWVYEVEPRGPVRRDPWGNDDVTFALEHIGDDFLERIGEDPASKLRAGIACARSYLAPAARIRRVRWPSLNGMETTRYRGPIDHCQTETTDPMTAEEMAS